jgi:hypothetical protein
MNFTKEKCTVWIFLVPTHVQLKKALLKTNSNKLIQEKNVKKLELSEGI